MPPKSAPAAVSVATFTITVPPSLNGQKLDAVVAMFVPFISKSKIKNALGGKKDKDPKSAQLGSVELVADGKKFKMKNPSKEVAEGDVYSIAIECPPKNINAELEKGNAAVAAHEEEFNSRKELIEAK
eukprot:Sspe_Gene.104732::Locus_81786_Transcript_1_2_Confidence_0.750_Length_473::g.104732::m.104732